GPQGAACYSRAERLAFLGRWGGASAPAPVTGPRPIEPRFGAGLDPCAAFQLEVSLAPGASAEWTFLLGEDASREEAIAVIGRLASPDAVEAAFQDVRSFWRSTLGAVQVETPSPALDLMVNGWLPYQNLACRMWARSALHQSGGAYGFRDQLQDAAALIYHRPGLTRRQILLHAAHQFVEGDVLHWWHPPPGTGIRTRFSDDLLWLPWVTLGYVATTGDAAILDEPARFLAGAPLDAGGWDGAWYRRAYYDDGTPLGSRESDECRIDALAQAWAVLSGAAPADRARLALLAMERELVDRGAGLIRLLTPPFDRTPHDPGYIKGYLPGVRENGGQYTHAALWAVRALAEAGCRELAAPLLEMLNPIRHGDSPEAIARYRAEPYVVAGDGYSGARRRRQPALPAERLAVSADHVGVEPGARLERPLLGGEVHVDDPEPLGVALTPLEIVEQRPGEVPAEVDALFQGGVRGAQVIPVVLDPQRIGDVARPGLERRIVECGPVLGDVERHRAVPLPHPF